MRIAFLTSATVALAGSVRDVLGEPTLAVWVPEPVWFIVWGLALLSLAGVLRTGLFTRRKFGRHESSVPGTVPGLSPMDTSVARPV